MKKADLLQTLSSKFYKVLTPITQGEENGLKKYGVIIYDKKSDSLRRHILIFYVENEGQVDEVAYWNSREPKPVLTESPRQKLLAYIASKITDGTIRAGYIEESDSISETAVVKVVMEVSGNLVEKRIFIDKDPQGNLRQEVLP